MPDLFGQQQNNDLTEQLQRFRTKKGPRPPGSSSYGVIVAFILVYIISSEAGSGVAQNLLKNPMWYVLIALIVLVILGLRIVNQYQFGVVFRLGRIVNTKKPGLNVIIPFIDRLVKVDMRMVTMPIPSQKIISKDNVSIDVAAVAYFRVVDAVKALIAIENVNSAINQIAQTTIRNIIGQFTLDEVLSETIIINAKVKEMLDSQTEQWGVQVTIVEIKDIQLPEGMQRAMAKQAEAERERRAKIIAAEGEFQASEKLAQAADVMAAHPIALQLRNLQTLAEIAVEKNSTIIFPNQFMSTVSEVQKFMTQEHIIPKS